MSFWNDGKAKPRRSSNPKLFPNTIAASIHTSSAHAAIIVHLYVIEATHALVITVIGATTLLEFTATA